MIEPKITVGIPNFNGAKYIQSAIDSVLRQTYTDFELIISDDGSTDKSVEIIRKYENHPNVRILISEENRGLSYRLNEQVRLARGQYFCRMDSDDIMFPDRLNKQYEFLRINPEVDIVGSAAVVIDENNKVLGTRSLLPNGEKSRKCNSFIHPTVMGKTSFFRDNTYSEKFSGAEDSELWFRCMPFADFRTLNEPLLFYRDPLQLRVKTYISRLSLIESIFHDMHLANRFSKLSYLSNIARLKYQKIAVKTLDLLGMTDIWVKRRNTKCNIAQHNLYQSILDEETNPSYTD